MESLYIKLNNWWREIEINRGNNVTLNFTPINLNNPTSYISEYSFNISVPNTKQNNIIFRNLFTLDSIGVSDITQNKFEYRYMIDSDIVSAGVGYLVDWDNDNYNIYLGGALSEVMANLQNCKFANGTATDETEIDDYIQTHFGNVRLTPQLVKGMWQQANPPLNLNQCTDVKGIIGFAPEWRGYYDDFENGQSIDGSGVVSPLFAGGDSEGTELFEREIGEYRVYYQQPYIFVNKLFQMMQNRIAGFGYSLVLDNNFFNANNRNYTDVVYMLPSLFEEGKVEPETAIEYDVQTATANVGYLQGGQPLNKQITNALYNEFPTYAQSGKTQFLKITAGLGGSVSALPATDSGSITPLYDLFISSSNFIELKFVVYSTTDSSINYVAKKYAFTFISTQQMSPYYDGRYLAGLESFEQQLSNSGYTIIRNVYTAPTCVDSQTRLTINFPALAVTERIPINTDDNLFVRVEWNVGNTNRDVVVLGKEEELHSRDYLLFKTNTSPSTWSFARQLTIENETNKRGGQFVNLYNLFGDIKPFSVILKYCKLFNLNWRVDEKQRIIHIEPNRTMDIQYCINLNDVPFKLTKQSAPVNKKYLLFNMDEMNVDYISTYNENNEISYGSKRVSTNCNLNDESETLLSDITSNATMNKYVRVYNQLAGGIVEYEKGESMPINEDDGKFANVYGNFYYFNGLGNFENKINSGYKINNNGNAFVNLTTDYLSERITDKYYWHSDTSNGEQVSTYPILSEVGRNNQRLQFSIPKIVYSDVPDGVDLYNNFWAEWINMIYNSDNRKISVELDLTYSDYLDVKNGKRFVYIRNQIGIISKITWSVSKTKLDIVLLAGV